MRTGGAGRGREALESSQGGHVNSQQPLVGQSKDRLEANRSGYGRGL